MIAFGHVKGSSNLGDTLCTPGLYFFKDVPSVFFHAKRGLIPYADATIYGGGAIHRFIPDGAIAWGVGQTRKRDFEAVGGVDPSKYLLYGSRDWGTPGVEYAPCVSCMAPEFDVKYPITQEAVIYTNMSKGLPSRLQKSIARGVPSGGNRFHTLTEALAFLGSAETIYTNSYHGAYWGTLLGRQVVIVGAYSSKFFHYRFQPTIEAGHRMRYDEALEVSREYTLQFAARVAEVIFP